MVRDFGVMQAAPSSPVLLDALIMVEMGKTDPEIAQLTGPAGCRDAARGIQSSGSRYPRHLFAVRAQCFDQNAASFSPIQRDFFGPFSVLPAEVHP
jgi:hypothetical protein